MPQFSRARERQDAFSRIVISDDSKQPIRWFFGVLGLAATLSTFAFLPSFPGKIPALIGLGALGAGAFGLAGWRLITRRRLLRTLCTITRGDADVSCALGHRIYTQVLRRPYPSRELIDGWLQRFDLGVCQAYDSKGKIWGYMSLWPITTDAFDRLRTGEIGEDNLDGSMVAPSSGPPFTHWYVADILMDNQRFDKRVHNSTFAAYIKPLMIHACLCHLHKARQFASSFEILGLAVTPPGEKMLKREFMFERVLPTPPHTPAHKIFLKAFTTRELLRLLARLHKQAEQIELQITRTIATTDPGREEGHF